MVCKCSSYDIEEGWKCSVTGDRCLFLVPNSKYCKEVYEEGPDVEDKD